MAKAATRFYNMLVHLIKNNRLFEENVAIKNVWQKEGNTFLDIYFYRNQKSYVFDALFVHDILDLTNEKYYQNIEDFVADFRQGSDKAPEPEEPVLTVDKSIFQPIYVDLVIMSFIAGCCGDYNFVKKRIIFEYIKRRLPSTANLSRQYVETYINSLKPHEDEFYQALKDLNSKSQDTVETLSRELMKICLADGHLMYLEKMYIAELLQVLRDLGVRVDLGL
ncbi:MAG: hypothetical protein KHX55_06670 [Proteobacteria bacterium]|nr:hypothetical protein [Pseudomonadota bacterium]